MEVLDVIFKVLYNFLFRWLNILPMGKEQQT